MPEDTKKKINELREQINLHAHRYYELDDPLIADSEYDFFLSVFRHIR